MTMNRMLKFAVVSALLAGFCWDAGSASAQPQRGRRGRGAARPRQALPPATATPRDFSLPDRFLAVKGGTVHTMANGVLEGVTVLTNRGKIVEIGRNVAIPEDAEVIDAEGFHVYPGLIAVNSTGLVGGGSPDDSTNVFSINMVMGLAAGITTAVTGNNAAKLTFGLVDDIVVARNVFTTLEYSTRNPAQRRQLRQALDRVRQYLRDVDVYEEKRRTDSTTPAPSNNWLNNQYRSYLSLLKHETVAVVTANSAHQIREVAKLAQHYDFDVVVRGAAEGWTIAGEMARAGMSAIVTPRAIVAENKRLNRPTGSSIENAAILHQNGVTVAVIPGSTNISTGGIAGRDLMHLPMEAAFAVRGGLKNLDAERAITLDAARILGIDHRVGSIEVGKDADFFICDGELLHYMTLGRWTVVNGHVAYDKEKETLFSHIRPAGDRNAPPPKDYWPRRLGDDGGGE